MTNYLRLASGHWPISTTFGLVSAGTRKKFLLLLLVHFSATAWFTSFQAPLFDESDYFGYTVNWAKGHPERNQPLFDSKTPAMWPALLPALFKPVIQKLFHPQDFFFFLKAGRPFLYIYQAFGLFILFIWLFRLFGEKGWFWPLALFAFDVPSCDSITASNSVFLHAYVSISESEGWGCWWELCKWARNR